MFVFFISRSLQLLLNGCNGLSKFSLNFTLAFCRVGVLPVYRISVGTQLEFMSAEGRIAGESSSSCGVTARLCLTWSQILSIFYYMVVFMKFWCLSASLKLRYLIASLDLKTF